MNEERICGSVNGPDPGESYVSRDYGHSNA